MSSGIKTFSMPNGIRGYGHSTRPIDYLVDPQTGCWNVVSHKPSTGGYPPMHCNGRYGHLHRFIYGLVHGFDKIQNPKKVIRHTCDNPQCINPAHLLIGTYKDNAEDRKNRNRSNHPYGENNGRAKLTEIQVRGILQNPKELSQRKLAKIFGVSRTAIQVIQQGITWKHIKLSMGKRGREARYRN